MNSKKLHFILISVTILMVIGIGFSVYKSNILLKGRSDQLVKLKAQYASAISQQAQLSQDKKDLVTYKNLNEIAQTIVPQDKDQAEAVREIVNLAAASGIHQLSSITFPASTLGTVVPGTGNLTQVTAVKGIPGVYDLPITVQQTGTDSVPYNTFLTFLTKLEQNRRTAQVSSISVVPDPNNNNYVTFNLTMDEFIKP